MSEFPTKFLTIDADGYPQFSEVRVTDTEIGLSLLKNLHILENGAFATTHNEESYIVEPFDAPLVAAMVDKNANGKWKVTFPYGLVLSMDLTTLTLDEWDRFHGETANEIPFVFSRKAQAKFFELVDSFDDESITVDGQEFILDPWLPDMPEVETDAYWTEIYKTETPRWELNEPAPALLDMLPRLKMPKSRVLVLGCGSGNDAAEFARQGHVVTAVDFSESAIALAKEKYGNLTNIRWIQSDVFKLDTPEHRQKYDFVFEHTCFCAINPARRNELISIWRKCLAPGGQLMAVLFCTDRREAPPFGGSEWEYRERLQKHFQFLFWGRWRASIDRRQGKELFILGRTKN